MEKVATTGDLNNILGDKCLADRVVNPLQPRTPEARIPTGLFTLTIGTGATKLKTLHGVLGPPPACSRSPSFVNNIRMLVGPLA